MNLTRSGICLLLLICSCTTFAQKDIPSFGKVDKAELDMKSCSFDDKAEAMVLFDVAEVYCFLELNSMVKPLSSQLERHVRIKIFNKKGLDFANIHIRFVAEKSMEAIKNFSAQTINVDASGNMTVTKVDKSTVFTKKINKRYSELVFAFPDVRPGSIIEYKYRDEAEYLYALRDWYFQRSIPVKLSRYILDFPNELIITAQPQGGLPVKIDKDDRGNRNVKTFSMTEVPALRDEAYISCDLDYMQQVVPFLVALNLPGQISHDLLKTWPGIVKELMEDEDFGTQLKKNIPRTGDLDAMLANVSDPYKKMLIIYDYVKKNMEWNNTYGIWAMDGVKSAWKDKKGTTGEINLILVNLLKDADLHACPILVSTRDNGRVNTTIADVDQFDKVLAYVTIDDKTYVLDATDKYTPAKLIPFDVLYSEGLVIEKYDTYEWGWKPLLDEVHHFTNTSFIEATVDNKGLITGQAQVSSADYSRLQRIPQLKENKEKFVETYFPSNDNDLKIDSLVFQNVDNDSLPLIQVCKFSEHVSSSGNYNYFSANLFSGLEKNPFISDTRFSDIFFGANQFYSINANFTIPEGYSFDSLPHNSRMRLPDSGIIFTRYVTAEGKKLSVLFQLEFNKPVYSTDEYDMLREFYKKLFAMLNEQFVYKKD